MTRCKWKYSFFPCLPLNSAACEAILICIIKKTTVKRFLIKKIYKFLVFDVSAVETCLSCVRKRSDKILFPTFEDRKPICLISKVRHLTIVSMTQKPINNEFRSALHDEASSPQKRFFSRSQCKKTTISQNLSRERPELYRPKQNALSMYAVTTARLCGFSTNLKDYKSESVTSRVCRGEQGLFREVVSVSPNSSSNIPTMAGGQILKIREKARKLQLSKMFFLLFNALNQFSHTGKMSLWRDRMERVFVYLHKVCGTFTRQNTNNQNPEKSNQQFLSENDEWCEKPNSVDFSLDLSIFLIKKLIYWKFGGFPTD